MITELRHYKDGELSQLATGELVELIQFENEAQLAKWGIQTRSIFEWLAYLTEEVGELSEAASEHEYRNGRPETVRHEAIQVATLALKIAEMFG